MSKPMAIVKATYTKTGRSAKASLRYLQHRPGQDGQKITRALFGSDGVLTRQEAYRMIDGAPEGCRFFRFVISPDQKTEDTQRDLLLREITQATMDTLADRLQSLVHWVAAIHADHTPYRHVHIVALVPGRLQGADLKCLRQTATAASLQQRRQLDLVQEHQREQERNKQEEAEWSLGY